MPLVHVLLCCLLLRTVYNIREPVNYCTYVLNSISCVVGVCFALEAAVTILMSSSNSSMFFWFISSFYLFYTFFVKILSSCSNCACVCLNWNAQRDLEPDGLYFIVSCLGQRQAPASFSLSLFFLVVLMVVQINGATNYFVFFSIFQFSNFLSLVYVCVCVLNLHSVWLYPPLRFSLCWEDAH